MFRGMHGSLSHSPETKVKSITHSIFSFSISFVVKVAWADCYGGVKAWTQNTERRKKALSLKKIFFLLCFCPANLLPSHAGNVSLLTTPDPGPQEPLWVHPPKPQQVLSVRPCVPFAFSVALEVVSLNTVLGKYLSFQHMSGQLFSAGIRSKTKPNKNSELVQWETSWMLCRFTHKEGTTAELLKQMD